MIMDIGKFMNRPTEIEDTPWSEHFEPVKPVDSESIVRIREAYKDLANTVQMELGTESPPREREKVLDYLRTSSMWAIRIAARY